MIMAHGFDESNAERRERVLRNTLQTAGQLNNRIKHFLKNVDRNYSLTEGYKNVIKKKLRENL